MLKLCILHLLIKVEYNLKVSYKNNKVIYSDYIGNFFSDKHKDHLNV